MNGIGIASDVFRPDVLISKFSHGRTARLTLLRSSSFSDPASDEVSDIIAAACSAGAGSPTVHFEIPTKAGPECYSLQTLMIKSNH